MPSLSELALTTLVIFFGALIQGSVGFGISLLAVPLFLLIRPEYVPGPMLLLALSTCVLVTAREVRFVNKPFLLWTTLGRLPGTALGAALISSISERLFVLSVSGMILLWIALSCMGLKLRPTRNASIGAGFLSGFMATLSAVGGPPLALLLQGEKGPVLRATLSAVFVVGGIVSIIGLMCVHRFGMRELTLGATLLPGAGLGFLASGRCRKWFDQGRTAAAVRIIAGGAAALAILKEML